MADDYSLRVLLTGFAGGFISAIPGTKVASVASAVLGSVIAQRGTVDCMRGVDDSQVFSSSLLALTGGAGRLTGGFFKLFNIHKLSKSWQYLKTAIDASVDNAIVNRS